MAPLGAGALSDREACPTYQRLATRNFYGAGFSFRVTNSGEDGYGLKPCNNDMIKRTGNYFVSQSSFDSSGTGASVGNLLPCGGPSPEFLNLQPSGTGASASDSSLCGGPSPEFLSLSPSSVSSASGGVGPTPRSPVRRRRPCNPKLIPVWQINLNHCFIASHLLACKLMRTRGPWIAMLQEPYLYNNKICPKFKNASTFAIISEGRCRAALVVSKQLDAWALGTYSDGDFLAIEMRLNIANLKSIVIASMYLPQPGTVPSRKLENLVDWCAKTHRALLVGGDANAHHRVWGSTDVNDRGIEMLDFINSTNLILLNRGHSPIFIKQGRREVLDITLATVHLVDFIRDWHVSGEDSSSDHCYIRFGLSGRLLTENRKFRNIRKTNWDIFRVTLEKSLKNWEAIPLTSSEGVENLNNKISSALTEALNKSCPMKYHAGRHQPNPWWTPDLADLKKASRGLWKEAVRLDTPEAWDAYRQKQREFKKATRKSKRKSWRRFCTEVEGDVQASTFCRMLRADPAVQLGMLQKNDGSFTESPEEVLSLLLETHFPGRDVVDGVHPTFGLGDVTLIDRIITKSRIARAIRLFKPYKSPGLDGVYPAMLREGLESLVTPLRSLFAASLEYAYLPVKWREIKVVFIPKVGKDSYTKPKSYRPINLMSFILKTMERLILWYFKTDILARFPFHRTQFAFRTDSSVEAAIHQLVARLERALNYKEAALAVFLDIEGAFDNVTHKAILDSLQWRGCDPVVLSWVHRFLTGRIATASALGATKSCVIKKGSSQGGINSSTYWNLPMDNLLVLLSEQYKYCYSQAFADDLSELVVGTDISTLQGLMQKVLNGIFQ